MILTFGLLHYTDLCHAVTVCQLWNKVDASEQLWKRVFAVHFPKRLLPQPQHNQVLSAAGVQERRWKNKFMEEMMEKNKVFVLSFFRSLF
jgi:hypothetical protein